MRVGIISDSHDNEDNLKAIMGLMPGNIDALIHCGDLSSPGIIGYLDGLGLPVHCCFGNTDNRFMTTKACDDSKNVTLHGDAGDFMIGERRLAITHFPMLASNLAHTGRYDAVFYGHTHVQSEEKVNGTLLANPGEVVGRKGRPGCAVYDSEQNSIEFLRL